MRCVIMTLSLVWIRTSTEQFQQEGYFEILFCGTFVAWT